MREGQAQSRRRCGSGEPNPGEKVGKGEPIPGVDVARTRPVLVHMGPAASPVQLWAQRTPRVAPVPVASAVLSGHVGQQRRRGHRLMRSIDQLRCPLRRTHLRLVFRQRVIAARDTRGLTPTAQPIQAAGCMRAFAQHVPAELAPRESGACLSGGFAHPKGSPLAAGAGEGDDETPKRPSVCGGRASCRVHAARRAAT